MEEKEFEQLIEKLLTAKSSGANDCLNKIGGQLLQKDIFNGVKKWDVKGNDKDIVCDASKVKYHVATKEKDESITIVDQQFNIEGFVARIIYENSLLRKNPDNAHSLVEMAISYLPKRRYLLYNKDSKRRLEYFIDREKGFFEDFKRMNDYYQYYGLEDMALIERMFNAFCELLSSMPEEIPLMQGFLADDQIYNKVIDNYLDRVKCVRNKAIVLCVNIYILQEANLIRPEYMNGGRPNMSKFSSFLKPILKDNICGKSKFSEHMKKVYNCLDGIGVFKEKPRCNERKPIKKTKIEKDSELIHSLYDEFKPYLSSLLKNTLEEKKDNVVLPKNENIEALDEGLCEKKEEKAVSGLGNDLANMQIAVFAEDLNINEVERYSIKLAARIRSESSSPPNTFNSNETPPEIVIST